ncbi:MAG: nucleotide sugar dehydrogenase [bacterium]
MDLQEKILKKQAKIGIIGLGYVGLPLSVEFAKSGYDVLGFEIDEKKVDLINNGKSYITDISSDEIQKLVKSKKLKATLQKSFFKEMDVIVICVPTPLTKTKEPDISYIVNSVQNIFQYLRKDQLIILESTTYPGTTEEIVLPMLEKSGLKVGKDFYLAFSPERVDPANKKYTIKNTPKIVGGFTLKCKKLVKLFYQQAIDTVIEVSSTKVAEMIKLWENTFRSVNIGLANEMCLLCDTLKIDVWEVIKGASSKPYGFMAFYPGPGLGGHCIPVDPFYLSWKARTYNFDAAFIELAGKINNKMPAYVVSKIGDILNENEKCIKNSNILILGVSYKKDVGDTRESSAFEIIESLIKKGAKIYYNDPYVDNFESNLFSLKNSKLDTKLFKIIDCVVILVDHSNYDYKWIAKNATKIFDTRNALSEIKTNREKIITI